MKFEDMTAERIELDQLADAPAPVAVDTGSGLSAAPDEPFMMRFGRERIQPLVDRIVARSSLVGDQPTHDTRQFPWIAKLEANWRDIEAEADVALSDLAAVPPLAEISPDHRPIAPAGKWRSYFLYGYGYREDSNCRACPRTAELVSQIPGLNSAFFSILAPGTHIPPHVGVTKALMTCHLGIRVPHQPQHCEMRVADRYVHWLAGEALVFDDTYEHEVTNATDDIRVILLIQFHRPVGAMGKLVGGLFLWAVRRSRFVQDARRGVAAWAEGRLSR